MAKRVKTSPQQRKALRIAKQELVKFKRDFEAATDRKDRAALEQMIHDDFTLVDPNGQEVNKKRLIDDIVDPTTDFMKNFTRSEKRTVFHSSGTAARETATVKLRGKLKRRGDITGRYVNSATFLKGPDGWQMAGNTLHKL
jgi:ketosteroid isomerase-like protein